MIERGLRGFGVGLDALSTLPRCPGVYQFYAADGELLYLGKSVNLRARVKSYFHASGGHTPRTARLKHEAVRIEVHPTGSELEALLLESRLIKRHQPRYNVQGRRYEHYPFLKLTAEAFPRLMVTRTLVEDGSRYFGPFLSTSHLEAVVEALQPAFGLRSCAILPSHACLERDIGRCLGPCTGRVDEVYGERVQAAVRFVLGETGGVVEALEQEMLRASEAFAYERAARLRDRLHALQRLIAYQRRIGNADELDALVALPGLSPGSAIFLAIRRARWVGELRLEADALRARSASARLRAFLKAAYLIQPAPSTRIDRSELDEVQIVASWMYGKRTHPGVFPVAPETFAETARAAIAHARLPA
jgi:excinuclease UvrABC nuclease subunit